MTTRENLQALRQALGGWSQQRLSEALGLTVVTISRWECGVCKLGPRPLMGLRKLVKDCQDQRPLAFVEEQMADILEEEERRIFGTSMRETRKHWVEIAERNWRMMQALKAIEWLPMCAPLISTPMCPLCDQTQSQGHAPDCLIGNALSYGYNQKSGEPHHGGDAAPVESTLPLNSSDAKNA